MATGFITSTSSASMIESVIEGAYQLVFFTPEMLLDNRKWRRLFQDVVYATRLRCFVIDEAHTVKKW